MTPSEKMNISKTWCRAYELLPLNDGTTGGSAVLGRHTFTSYGPSTNEAIDELFYLIRSLVWETVRAIHLEKCG